VLIDKCDRVNDRAQSRDIPQAEGPRGLKPAALHRGEKSAALHRGETTHGYTGRVTALSAAVLLVVAGVGASGSEVDEFLIRIQDESADVRYAAWKAAGPMGPRAVVPLGDLMAGGDRGVAKAATEALANIAHYSARPDAPASERQAVASELIKLLSPDRPSGVRAEALHLLSCVGGAEAVDAAADLLTDPQLRDAARMALQRMPGKEATRALIEGLDAAATEFKPRIIEALGQRADAAAIGPLMKLTRDSDLALVGEAFDALARIGEPAGDLFTPEAVEKLSDDGLDRLGDAYLRYADNRAAKNDAGTAMGIYMAMLKRSRREHRRCGAVVGIGRAGSSSAIASLLPAAGDESVAVRAAVVEALAALKGADVDAKLVTTMAGAKPVEEAALLRALVARKSPQAMSALIQARLSPAEQVRRAAFELMAGIAEPKFEPYLLAAAKTEKPPVKSVALGGYLKLAGLRLSRGDRPNALNMYHQALELADGPELKVEALGGIGVIASPSSVSLVREHMTGETAEAAARAYVALAAGIAESGDKQRAIDMLSEAVGKSPSPAVMDVALVELAKLGVDTSVYARRVGFVTTWWLIGPFPSPEKSAYENVFFPEQTIDLEAGGTLAGKTLRWKKVSVDRIPTVINLVGEFKASQNVAAYGYAEIDRKVAREVKIKAGSDDGIVIWLNGERIHGNNASRGCQVDQDVVAAGLKKGKNTLLVKVLQGNGDWGFCVRITNPDDSPLDLSK